MEERLFTLDELVEYLKIPKSTLYKLSEKKDLPSCKIGKQLRFRRSSIDEWLKQKETGLTHQTNPALFIQNRTQDLSSKHILLVDDDRLVLKTITKFLQSCGYNVEAQETGEGALKKLEEASFDLIIMDIRMPGMDGIQTLTKIRQLQYHSHKPNIPEIIITGFIDTEAEKQAENLGIRDYFYKPFVSTDFINTIERKLALALN